MISPQNLLFELNANVPIMYKMSPSVRLQFPRGPVCHLIELANWWGEGIHSLLNEVMAQVHSS